MRRPDSGVSELVFFLGAALSFVGPPDEQGFAFVHRGDSIRDPGMASRSEKARQRFIEGFCRQAESAEVHGNHALCAEVEEGLQSIFRRGVDAAEEVRAIGADGQQSELWLETGDLVKAGEVGGVSRVVEGVLAGLDEIAAVAAMIVVEIALAPVLRGRHDNAKRARGKFLPPGQSMDAAEAERANEIVHAFRNDDLRGGAAQGAGVIDDGAQGRNIEVVHVGVSLEDEVNGGQVLDFNARAADSTQNDEPFGENGVDKDIFAGELQ